MADILARQRTIVGSTAEWATNDIVLGDGEIALEWYGPGLVRAKIGDGVNQFSSCAYLGGAFDVTVADARYVNESDTVVIGGVSVANKWPRLNASGKLDSSFTDFTAADGRYVNESDTYQTATPAGANKWPRLSSDGKLDVSLVRLGLLSYRGQIDASTTPAPPGSQQPGYFYMQSVDGIVGPGWPGVIGLPITHGNFIGWSDENQWQIFDSKIDPDAYLRLTGDEMMGKITTFWSTPEGAGFRILQGADPNVVYDGDIWYGPSRMSARINGISYDFAIIDRSNGMLNAWDINVGGTLTSYNIAGTHQIWSPQYFGGNMNLDNSITSRFIAARYGGNGGSALASGGPNRTGYLELYDSALNRNAYIGFILTGTGVQNINYQNEIGGGHVFNNNIYANAIDTSGPISVFASGKILVQHDGANAFIRSQVGHTYLGANGGNYMAVQSNGDVNVFQSMRIGNTLSFGDGNFWISQNVTGNPGFNWNPNCWFDYNRGNGYIRHVVNGSEVFHAGPGELWSVGNVWAASDKRLKKDLNKIENALDKIDVLVGYTFTRTDIPGKRQAGLLAQDVEVVLPEASAESSNGFLSVDALGVVALLVEGMKELRAELAELKAKLT